MNKQNKVLIFIHQEYDEPKPPKKITDDFNEKKNEDDAHSSFRTYLTKLRNRGLLEYPEEGETGVYQITERGENKAEYLLNPDKSSEEKPEDYREVVDKLLEYLYTEEEEKIHNKLLSGETYELKLSELDKFDYLLIDYLETHPASFKDAVKEALRDFRTEDVMDYEIRFDLEYWEKTIGKALNSSSLGEIATIEGIVEKAEENKSELVSGIFECSQCGDRYEKKQDSSNLKSPYKCECGSRKFEVVEKYFQDVINLEITDREKFQKSLKVRVAGNPDLSEETQDELITGSRIRFSGILKEQPVSKKSKKHFHYLDTISYQKKGKGRVEEDLEDEKIQEVKEKIKVSSDPFRDFAKSLAPSIGSMGLPKEAISASLIGSPEIETPGKGGKDYGRINTAILSPPGTGKSGLLGYVQDTFSGVYKAEGKGGSGTGLTATVEQTDGGSWKLVAGKVVHADRGILEIDEFDKFPKGELTNLNTPMEDGWFNVDKASVNSPLPGRATIIATGNFDRKLDNHTEPKDALPEKGEGLYDRFGLMVAVVDQDTEDAHQKIGQTYMGGEKDVFTDVPFAPEEQRAFRYLVKQVDPILTSESFEELEDYAVAARGSNSDFEGESNRFLVHLIKLCLMFARANLRDKTTVRDADKAVKLMREARDSLGLDFGEESPWIQKMNRKKALRETLQTMERQKGDAVEVDKLLEDTLVSTQKFKDIEQVREYYQELKSDGEFYEPESGKVKSKTSY